MKVYRNILSIGFILLTLVSSSNFMVGLHFCGDEVGVAFFSKAECGMEMNVPPCHRQEKSCCDDEVIVHQGQDFKNTINEFQFQPLQIAGLVSPVVIAEILSESASRFELNIYHPPLRTIDLTISQQVFRI